MDRRADRRRRSVLPWSSAAGYTLLEALLVAGLVGLLTIVAVPQLTSAMNRSRGLAAARFLASRMALARSQAVGRSANVALRFAGDPGAVRFSVFMDGNGNGVRAADIAAGIDPLVEPSVLLSDLFPGVRIALGESGEEDAVQVGAGEILSFTPMGTATSGSVYIRGRDGTQWAVRVLGTTARTRILRYSASTDDWVQAF